MDACRYPDCRCGLWCDRSKKWRPGVEMPSDLAPDDVKAFFSLPDDDDTMHMRVRQKI